MGKPPRAAHPASRERRAMMAAKVVFAGVVFTGLAGPATAAEQAGGFDGLYAGTVAVTSVRAVPCETGDFTPSITIAGGVASLVYLPDAAGKSVVLKAPVSKGGIFAGEGKGEFAINMSGTVSRDRIVAKAWAWNCEYAMTMQKSDKPAAIAVSARD